MAVHQLLRALSLAAVVTVGLSACGDDAGSPDTTAAASATTSTVVLATGPAATTADTSFIGRADSAGCRADQKTLEVAVEAFMAVLGRTPRSQLELVAEGYLNSASTNYDLGPDASVVPLATGRCA